MTTTYKFYKSDPDFSDFQNIMKLEDGKIVCYIPKAEDNTDYQEYLEWVAAGGVTQAAD